MSDVLRQFLIIMFEGIAILLFISALYVAFRYTKDGFITKRGMYISMVLLLFFIGTIVIVLWLVKPSEPLAILFLAAILLLAFLIIFVTSIFALWITDKMNIRTIFRKSRKK